MKTDNSNPAPTKYINLTDSEWNRTVNEKDFKSYQHLFTLDVRLTPKLKKFMAENNYPIYRVYMGYVPTGNSYHPYRALYSNAIETKLLKEFEKNKTKIKISRCKKSKIVLEDPILTKFYNRDKYTRYLFSHLADPTIANIQWLQEAHQAFIYSARNRGIMTGFISGRREEDDFYYCLIKAMNAHYRHTQTDYDLVDKRGMSDEQIDELRAQYSRNG